MKNKGRKLLAVLAILCMVVTMMNDVVVSYATEVSGNVESEAAANGFLIDNTGTLVGYNGVGGDVVIPSEVTSISASVFAGNKSLTSVTVPSSVAVLGTGVFANCTSLTTVTIQGNISSIPAQTFFNCENLKSVYVPTSVTAIGADAFSGCVSLSGITIPPAVTTIGDRAFFDCVSLGGVSIPDAVSSIGTNAFAGCSNMTSYTVDSNNAAYSSSGGCLYNKTMTKLLSCPEGRTSVALADGTKIIGSYAFYNCDGIQTLTLPTSVKTIEANAFAECGISDITILSGVTSIGSQSGWTADIIYGENDSAAEVYATSNSIVFQALSTSSNPGSSDTEKPGDENGGTGDNGNTGSGSAGSNTGNAGNGGSTANTNVGSSTNSGTAYSSGSANAAATAGQKDATPKTGDGINPVFFFCLAFLLIGASLLLVGKKKTAR